LTWVGAQTSSREKTVAVAQQTMQSAYDWMRGVIAEGGSWLRQEEVPDALLVARVNARLNRLVSQPGAIDVGAEQGQVTLSGSVLDRERDPLLSSIASIRGVRDVVDHLEVQKRTTTIMGVQDQPTP
jgi:hypothetical protein